MADVHTPEQRSRNMRAIRGTDTKPEMQLRRYLHARGYRYRLHVKKLPGRPDIVFIARKKVVFVNGCFWHSHDCRFGRVTPTSNSDFWAQKRLRTVERDKSNLDQLIELGWQGLVVWECELRAGSTGYDRVEAFLRRNL